MFLMLPNQITCFVIYIYIYIYTLCPKTLWPEMTQPILGRPVRCTVADPRTHAHKVVACHQLGSWAANSARQNLTQKTIYIYIYIYIYICGLQHHTVVVGHPRIFQPHRGRTRRAVMLAATAATRQPTISRIGRSAGLRSPGPLKYRIEVAVHKLELHGRNKPTRAEQTSVSVARQRGCVHTCTPKRCNL